MIAMYRVQLKYKPFAFLVDIIGYPFFFWKKLVPFKKSQIKRILVIRLDHIGDVLLATPVVRALKRNWPDAEIDLLIRPFTKELINTNKYITKIHTLNPPWFNRGTASFIDLIKFIFHNLLKYDLVVELHADPRNIILASLLGKYTIGYAVRGCGFLLNKSAEYSPRVKHMLERNLDVIRTVGIDSNSKIDVFLTEKDIQFAKTLFSIHGIKKAVCIVPGTGRINKLWLDDRWAELADYLIKKYAIKIVFLGGREDIPRIKSILRRIKSKNCINMAGKTSLRESAAVIKKSRTLVCPDTGMMHIAKAVGTPCIALFGPVNPKIWGYDDKKNKSLFAKLPCSFCDVLGCHNKKKNLCMSAISVSEVIEAIDGLNVL